MTSEQPLRVLLLGATGFLGSYVLRALLARGHKEVAIRRKHDSRTPIPLLALELGQLEWKVLSAHTMTHANDWIDAVAQVDVVINCIGILRQRWAEKYNDVHHLMPAAIADACAKTGVRFIHTSALGLHEHAKSRFLSSKLLGEKALAKSGADYCIVRPSLIDGLGGFGASWLRMLASWPMYVVPVGAVGRIAAVQASDLGEAYGVLAQMPSFAQQREANLGGERHYGYGEFLQLLRGNKAPAVQIPLPDWATRLGAHLCDLVRFSPFSYGHCFLLQRDNLPIPNHLPSLLGRAPRPITHTSVALKDDFRMS